MDSERARKLIDRESASFSTDIKVVEGKQTEELKFVPTTGTVLLQSCCNSSSVTEEKFQHGSISVLKDSTNRCASLVPAILSDHDEDDDDDHKPLAKKQRLCKS